MNLRSCRKQSRMFSGMAAKHSLFKVPTLKGFTLLEILVTVALFSLLGLMLFSIVQSATILWRENERRVDSYREARAALNIISSDLRNIFTRIDPNDPDKTLPTLYSIYPDGQRVGSTQNAPGVDTLPGTLKADSSAMFFFSQQTSTSQSPDQDRSDICQIGYYLAFNVDGDDLTGGTTFGSYKIFRYFRSSTPTFNFLSTWFTSTTPSALFTNIAPPTRIDLSTDETGNPAAPINDPLAYYITDFQITPLSREADGASPTIEVSTPRNDGRLTGAFEPDFVDITITATNSDLGRRLQTRADWDGIDPVSTTFIQNSRVFSTRVSINKNVLQ